MEIEGSLLLVGLCPVSAITQESNENPIAFLERLKDAFQNFTNLDLDSYERQVILKDKFACYSRCFLTSYVQAGFRKGSGTRDQIANICWIIAKAREFQKNIISALLTMPKPLTVWITINCGKF